MSAGERALKKEEKKLLRQRKKQIEEANKMLIPVGKKTNLSLGIISFDPKGALRLKGNTYMKVYELLESKRKLAPIMKNLSGKVRITIHQDGCGRGTCHISVFETGEIYEEVRKLFLQDEEVLSKEVRIKALDVDEMLNLIASNNLKSVEASYAAFVRGKKDWKRELVEEMKEEQFSFKVGDRFGESFMTLSFPSDLGEGFLDSISYLGCEAFVSIDVNALSGEEVRDFNRAMELRYNRKVARETNEKFFNVSMSMMIRIDSDDARKIAEQAVLTIGDGYNVLVSPGFKHQKEIATSIFTLGITREEIMRNMKEETMGQLLGGEVDADAKIKV